MSASSDQQPSAHADAALSNTPKKTRAKVRLPTPEALAAVALIDAVACAGAGGMGVSWWHNEVAAGRAPAPVIRRPRCTRWRLADVQAFWRSFGSQPDAGTTDTTKARASKASAAAQVKRSKPAAVPTQAGD